MADKRKPIAIMLLRFQGKKKSVKVEVFLSTELEDGCRAAKHEKTRRYRIRIKGKWHNDYGRRKYLTKTEFRNLFWRALPI